MKKNNLKNYIEVTLILDEVIITSKDTLKQLSRSVFIFLNSISWHYLF